MKPNLILSMSVVTYLLGAGASAQCLPVVSDMAEDISKTRTALDLDMSPCLKNDRLFSFYEEISSEFNWLREICNTHFSVDTYAKKLHLSRNNSGYNRLKRVLSLYFTIKQKLSLLDKRYDNFWASILDSIDILPGNLRIVSWNYDYQLERSFQNFTGSLNLTHAYSQLKMWSFHDDAHFINKDEFGVFKLNGSAKFMSENRPRYLVEETTLDPLRYYTDLMVSYSNLKPTESINKNLLSFAWEHDISSDYYKKLKESVSNTTVLVVIGYSFPVFNRKIDKLLINEYMPHLHTVYFQAPDAENLEERFNTLADNPTRGRIIYKHLIKDKNQFAFPNELDVY